MIQICRKCHKEYDLSKYDPGMKIPTTMRSQNLCFECAVWENFSKLNNNKEGILGIPVITQKYNNATSSYNPRYLGFIPVKLKANQNPNCCIRPMDIMQPVYKILFNDGRLFTINNFWRIGQVPNTFLDKFEVNARFISNEQALNLISRLDTKVSQDETHYIVNTEEI